LHPSYRLSLVSYHMTYQAPAPNHITHIQSLENRLAVQPTDLGLLQQLASAYTQQSLFSKALAILERCAKLAPLHLDIQFKYGLGLQRSGLFDLAENQFKNLLSLNPRHRSANFHLAQLMHLRGEFKASIPYCQIVAESTPNDVSTVKMLGYAALRAHEYLLAEKVLSIAAHLNPTDAETLSYLGVTLNYLRRTNESEQLLRTAATLAPNSELILFCHAENLLLRGQIEEGFQVYERALTARRSASANLILSRIMAIPPWQNEPLSGHEFLIWIDQGHGDAIMLMRYCHILLQKGPEKISVVGHPVLKRLLETIDPRVVHIDAAGTHPITGATYCCSLSSLPARLGTTRNNIPTTVPYFSVPEALQEHALNEYVISCKGLKVGVVWAGNPDTPLNHLRSVPLALFAPLAGIRSISLISLQFGEERKQIARAGFKLIDPMDQAQDFLDTAALISQLDLVIAVDTAVAHLAGALGKPVWLLNRYESEWRWMLDRTDSPWYPSMRIFNQRQQGDWKPVIRAIRKELEVLSFKARKETP